MAIVPNNNQIANIMKITIGRIVEFFPNGNKEYELPNGMETAPAIVTQTFGLDMVNMNVFCADPRPNFTGSFRTWSVPHKSANVADGVPFWDWFPKMPK